MAQYKVPQDVEADDKLLGPFSFRQFVYLLIAGGLIALSVALFQLFPLLAIIPLPFILLLGALALPLKKDQPMETYLAAIVSYYLKPRTRRWTPGQRETTITITAPKKKDDDTRTRDITGEEATHRLSFLADIVDTEGYAIKGGVTKQIDDAIVMEANTANDIFESNYFDSLENTIAKDENVQRQKIMQEMRDTIEQIEKTGTPVKAQPVANPQNANVTATVSVADKQDVSRAVNNDTKFNSPVVVMPDLDTVTKKDEKTTITSQPTVKNKQILAKPSIIELANNPDYSIATISKEANRLKERDEGEVFISLH